MYAQIYKPNVDYQYNYQDFAEKKIISTFKSSTGYYSNNNKSINFVQKKESSQIKQSLYSVNLDYNILKLIPRNFIITTNNSSSNFNTEILISSSSVISKFHTTNPQNLEYHLDINDKDNILEKISLLYQGEFLVFEKDSLSVCKEIAELLDLTCFPNFMLSEKMQKKYIFGNNNNLNGVQISSISYISNKNYCTFTIHTKKNKYDCNIFGIHSSTVIKEYLKSNPTKSEFAYNFEDEFNEFQYICNFFNMQKIYITKDNFEFLKQIAEDLGINLVIDEVNEYIKASEKVDTKIDEQQPIIDSIDDLFELLYQHKNKQTIEFVKNMILNSKWSKTEEKVQELAAIVLQVVKTDFCRHQFLIDLLIQLDNEAKETNQLKLLIQIIVKQLMDTSFIHKQPINKNDYKQDYKGFLTNFGFIYKLYKNGFIPEKSINYKIINFNRMNSCFIVWFLPELIEYHSLEKVQPILKYLFNKDFIESYLPDKIDEYKKMRDSGIPDDRLTVAIRDDDVETLQSIVSKGNINLSKLFVPFNIFEASIKNGQTRYINYAAAYGSIKCFKYLLLNDNSIDNDTLSYSILGGNNEIIQIVDQRKDEIQTNNQSDDIFMKRISFAIALHRNDLVDWLLSQNISNQNDSILCLQKISEISAYHGNIHALIEVVDKYLGLPISSILKYASKNGFYTYLKVVSDLFNDCLDSIEFNCKSLVVFGNVYIFKLFSNYLKIRNLSLSLLWSLTYENESIIKCIFENNELINQIINGNSFYQTSNNDIIMQLLLITNKSIFEFIFRKLESNDNDKLLDIYFRKDLIFRNIENAKFVIDEIYKNNCDQNFTTCFFNAVKANSLEICKYFVDKNVLIDFNKISLFNLNLISVKDEIIKLFIDKINDETKLKIFTILPQAILNKKYILVDFLLKEGANTDDALHLAVKSNDAQMVDIILKYNSHPSYINKVTQEGTCLTIASRNNNFQIVQRLLSLPGIDPSLYCNDNQTPLSESVKNRNLEILNAILDFYGEKIQQKRWMINEAIKVFINNNNNNDNNNKNSKNTQVKNNFSKNTQIKNNDKNINDETRVIILSRLLKIKNIDFNDHYGSNTFLTYACSTDDIDLIQTILQSGNIDVNLYESSNGNTPLIIAVEKNNYEIAKLLIENPQTNINLLNYNMDNALSIAAKNNYDKIVDLIINSEKFDPKESHLDYVFFVSSQNVARKLCTLKQLDVNYESFKNNSNNNNYTFSTILADVKIETPLTKMVNENNEEMVDKIIHHESFVLNKSQARNALFLSISNNNIEIFKKLLLLLFNNDVNLCDSHGKSIFSRAITNRSDKILQEIINNEKLNMSKIDIVDAFVQLYGVKNDDANNPIESMKIIYEYDKNHNHLIDFNNLLPNGKSFFTSMGSNSKYDDDIINFFLENGVDPCKPDKSGIYPLQNSITIRSEKSVQALLNSNKIDLNMKIHRNNGQTSYLFLAVFSSVQIVRKLLNKEEVDINTTDENGDTALIIAAKYKKSDIVSLLFEYNDLDYHHINNKGLDAICTVQTSQSIQFTQNLSKFGYKSSLLNSMKSDDSVKKINLSKT